MEAPALGRQTIAGLPEAFILTESTSTSHRVRLRGLAFAEDRLGRRHSLSKKSAHFKTFDTSAGRRLYLGQALQNGLPAMLTDCELKNRLIDQRELHRSFCPLDLKQER